MGTTRKLTVFVRIQAHVQKVFALLQPTLEPTQVRTADALLVIVTYSASHILHWTSTKKATNTNSRRVQHGNSVVPFNGYAMMSPGCRETLVVSQWMHASTWCTECLNMSLFLEMVPAKTYGWLFAPSAVKATILHNANFNQIRWSRPSCWQSVVVRTLSMSFKAKQSSSIISHS